MVGFQSPNPAKKSLERVAKAWPAGSGTTLLVYILSLSSAPINASKQLIVNGNDLV